MMTALYRRYRPDTFEEVIGQEHVTKALQASLANGRINHAYLFSGPRGCGKTTSARILARCLNCAEGPTPTPCGKCDSCRDLGTGGPGSLDVVEIDSASHNGVDDARELRERATFAPARDRFKIFILDEAHMVTPQGFNALLKLVEEPPPHIKFIFATTDPDKVIGTIRSRTHHYPFRLVAPEVLRQYLADLCEKEGVQVEDGVLGLAVRAGGGSVRDSLSILDQLIAGETEPVLHYERAVALLGYTDSGLLSGLVDGLIAGSGAEAYGVVDRMIQTGHEPRRFVEDLLQYLRNLVIMRLAGAEAETVLGDVPAAELEKMRIQVAARPARTWTRAAELIDGGLSEMGGASSPRLSLELLVAKLLLEFGGASEKSGTVPTPELSDPPASPKQSDPPASPEPTEKEAAWKFEPTPWGIPGESESVARAVSETEQSERSQKGLTPSGAAEEAVNSASPVPAGDDYETIRSRWGEIMETLQASHSATASLLSEHGQLQGMRGATVEIAFQNQGMLRAFGERHTSALAAVIAEVTGINASVQGVIAGFGAPSAERSHGVGPLGARAATNEVSESHRDDGEGVKKRGSVLSQAPQTAFAPSQSERSQKGLTPGGAAEEESPAPWGIQGESEPASPLGQTLPAALPSVVTPERSDPPAAPKHSDPPAPPEPGIPVVDDTPGIDVAQAVLGGTIIDPNQSPSGHGFGANR
ncbi:MAG: DNA polymerase III subunit gamma and tau [Mobiluncus porci]|uniref:DNA polymerase III subunit gamma and tau n=1 Tax=Mobiluncus porci TaxID=2652278 RepID=UPI0023F09A1F|nr:DNA polymerase III subunit gamma and tau [Mobiluncus porci]MDD7541088.1 DNA polymerase III subunit gamma and tau [Mobiluncus porci]MDY5747547.1 DNA polymerase III subunit gamma and tau [Mobiluncus porci]